MDYSQDHPEYRKIVEARWESIFKGKTSINIGYLSNTNRNSIPGDQLLIYLLIAPSFVVTEFKIRRRAYNFSILFDPQMPTGTLGCHGVDLPTSEASKLRTGF